MANLTLVGAQGRWAVLAMTRGLLSTAPAQSTSSGVLLKSLHRFFPKALEATPSVGKKEKTLRRECVTVTVSGYLLVRSYVKTSNFNFQVKTAKPWPSSQI
jgi:hypothetical protein